jgi:hypothetical protein
VLDACRAAWEVAAGERMSFHFLREHFGPLPAEVWAAYGC